MPKNGQKGKSEDEKRRKEEIASENYPVTLYHLSQKIFFYEVFCSQIFSYLSVLVAESENNFRKGVLTFSA
jgi:hypothetical protein